MELELTENSILPETPSEDDPVEIIIEPLLL
jgi:hypothetical protein